MDYSECSAGKNQLEDADAVEMSNQTPEKTECFGCSAGQKRPRDKDFIERYNQAVAKADSMLYDSAFSDLMHLLYHKVRYKGVAHADAMDNVLDCMQALCIELDKGLSGMGSEIRGSGMITNPVYREELNRLGRDGEWVIRIAMVKMFGTKSWGGIYQKGLSTKDILDGKVVKKKKGESPEQFLQHKAARKKVFIDDICPGSSDEVNQQNTVLKELQYEHHLDEEVDSSGEAQRQQAILQRDLQEAIRALPAVIEATKNSVERETLSAILAYAKDCADKGELALLSSVGIEIVSHEYDADLLKDVRLGRCLGPACPLELPEGVRIAPKIYWETSTQLEAYLHQLPDTTNEWASASQASIHKRIIRVIPILKQHSLLREQLVNKEEEL